MLSRTVRHLIVERSTLGSLPAHEDPMVLLPALRTLNESFGCIAGIGFHAGRDQTIDEDLRAHLASRELIGNSIASPTVARLLRDAQRALGSHA